MASQKLIHIVGRSRSGKTTLAEKLIAAYHARGLTVAALKSVSHDFEIDYPGKDTWRFRAAGAGSVAITDGGRVAVVSTPAQGRTPLEIARRHLEDTDILILEGFKDGATPKFEVIGDSIEEPLFRSGIADIRFIVTDRDIEGGLPRYRRDDVAGVLEAIERHLF